MWTPRFPLTGEDIPFLEKEKHLYFDSEGRNYISVSNILSKIKPKFDVDQKALEYSLRKKIPIEDVLSLWEEKKNTGLDYGTEVHENIENYFLNKKIPNPRYSEVVENIFNNVYSEDGNNELICFDKDKLMCGTADYVVFKENTFDIFDFKTNKKFNFENQYDDKFLLSPVDHLPNSEYFIYALQLSFYARMLEQLTNLKCGFLNIFWLKRQIDNKLFFKAKWMRYTVPFLKKEVDDIIERFL